MFRVNSYQAVLRVSFASVGLMVCGAVAQDQPSQINSSQANSNQSNQDQKPAADVAGAAQAPSTQAQAAPDAVDPLKRPTNEKQRQKNARGLKQELGKTYKKWLEEDVVYIITDEERAAFKQLSNDEERDNFIEAFWQRRDPTPDTEENEYKEEHYQRIAYANEHFAAGVPAGEPIAAASTSFTASPTRSTRIPQAEPTSAPWKRAAARLPLSLLKTGDIATSITLARKSLSNSWTRACAANIT
jgi:hypothetical protein